jgi:hypothetical protein
MDMEHTEFCQLQFRSVISVKMDHEDKIFNMSAGLQKIAGAAFSCLKAELYLLKMLEIC